MAFGADSTVTVDLLARDKSERDTKSFAKNIDKVADSADKASKKTDKFGESSDKAVGRIQKMDHEIAVVRQNLAFLHEAFGDASDAAERMDISKGIRKAEADLKRITKSRDALKDLLPDPEPAAKNFLQRFSAELSDGQSTIGAGLAKGLRGAGSAAIPVLAGMAIGAAPLIGGTIAGAIIGGAGVGGVVGGAILAAKDTRVKAAGELLSLHLLSGLQSRAGVFVEPMIKASRQISSAFDESADDINRIFKNSARFVEPLAKGATYALTRITRGIADLTDGAGPVIRELSAGIGGVGDAIGQTFSMLKDNGVEAALALRTTFGAVAETIKAVGGAINLLTESYGFLAKVGAFGPEVAQQYIQIEASAKIAAAGNQNFAGSLGLVQGATGGAAAGITNVNNSMLNLNNTMRAATDPLFGFLDAQVKVWTSQGKLDKAIKEHGSRSKEAAAATRELAAAALELDGRAAEVGTTADGKLTPALRRTLVQAGLTEKEIRGVEAQLRAAKRAVDSYNGSSGRAHVSLDTGSTESKIEALKKRLASIKNRTVYVTTVFNEGRRIAVEDRLGRTNPGEFRATGGPVRAGKAYVVGDGGRPEVFVPDRDGKIVPSIEQYARSNMSGGDWSRPGAAAGGTIAVTVSVAGGADSKVADLINNLIRNGQIRISADAVA
jgi:hypothetical protein